MTCGWYVLRYPRFSSGPCGKRAKYSAVNRASVPVSRVHVCGTHAKSAAALGHDVYDGDTWGDR